MAVYKPAPVRFPHIVLTPALLLGKHRNTVGEIKFLKRVWCRHISCKSIALCPALNIAPHVVDLDLFARGKWNIIHIPHDLANTERLPGERCSCFFHDFSKPSYRKVGIGASYGKPELNFFHI